MDLKGKKILVTGGSLGIGKATALMMVEKGATVLITGRNKERVEKAAQEIGAMAMVFDLADTDHIAENVAIVLKKLGGIDVLLNNAGIGEFGLLGDITLAGLQRVFNTNVFGLTMLTQALLPTFKEQQSGNIINIGSTAALKGFAHGSVYTASKFAVRALTQCWQAELRKDNIRVFLVNPSEVTTAFNQTDRVEKEVVDNKLRPEEIAHVIVQNLEMDNRGFVPEVSVWATNPF
ncbi:short-chain dehydrogenase [Putridiphycobacter roseus]|uniref:Short-chain dehydrogenase n=1 Tax=Putridiphycobacter roseus TaxID=2219161 RepID=A0A2W1NB76_9FLAO|nr:SDR family NAD(P)-dependent oxidoreductase [Putridiphycobacter roseus]PZE16313.1 short-chain dehydrogenase [Putridiphycobacter roseus]